MGRRLALRVANASAPVSPTAQAGYGHHRVEVQRYPVWREPAQRASEHGRLRRADRPRRSLALGLGGRTVGALPQLLGYHGRPSTPTALDARMGCVERGRSAVLLLLCPVVIEGPKPGRKSECRGGDRRHRRGCPVEGVATPSPPRWLPVRMPTGTSPPMLRSTRTTSAPKPPAGPGIRQDRELADTPRVQPGIWLSAAVPTAGQNPFAAVLRLNTTQWS